MQLLLLLAITLSMTVLLSAQEGPPKGGPAPASSAMTLTVSGFGNARNSVESRDSP